MVTGKFVNNNPQRARLAEELVDVKSKLVAMTVKHYGADYFADRLALPDSLIMVPRDGKNEVIIQKDDRFDFNRKSIVQVKTHLLSYSHADPIKVSMYKDPFDAKQM